MNGHWPLVAAVVPIFNRLEMTRRFVASFRTLSYRRKILVICDDGSTDGTGEFLRQQPDVITVRGDGSLWWSGGTNAAIREALKHQPDYVLTINDDAIFDPDYLELLVSEALAFPGAIMASCLTQLQTPELAWSIGATYFNYKNVLYINDCYGAPLAHLRGLMRSPVLIDTTPGNGVLYPAAVFEKAGFFDETWTPQYHGDTLFVHRAARQGFVPRLSLNAVVENDMDFHLAPKLYDPFTSLKSAHYAPAFYKSVEEREGKERALESLEGIVAALPSEFCAASAAAVKLSQGNSPRDEFTFAPHIARVLAGGAFMLLGYDATRAVSVTWTNRGTHLDYQVQGQGVLTLVLRVRRKCQVHLFVVTAQPPEHLDVIMDCQSRGQERLGDEWVTWFQVELEPSDFARVPLAVISHGAAWRGVYLALHENVAERYCTAVPRT